MTATIEQSSAELKAKLAEAERELDTARSALPPALKTAALAQLRGTHDDGVASVRALIAQLEDRCAGLRALAVDKELEELEAEIGGREAKYKRDRERLAELKATATREPKAPAGTGPAFAAALRADQEARRADFAKYEKANLEHIDERRAIAELIRRRDELALEVL